MAAFVESLLDRFHERTPIRAGSLIVTVFGDAVVPRGGALSLTSLHEIMRAFRISDTLVRTALSRLVSDGWFERWKVGRNSYYRLTGQGQQAFAQATQRIYADPPQDWNGSFDLVLLENTQDRSALRAKLSEVGFGALGPDLLIAAARALCGTIYKTLLPAAERWIDTHAQNDKGPLPGVDAGFGQRFAAVAPVRATQAS
jgi:phenylacetic acid degradation operon negative regulatory protein